MTTISNRIQCEEKTTEDKTKGIVFVHIVRKMQFIETFSKALLLVIDQRQKKCKNMCHIKVAFSTSFLFWVERNDTFWLWIQKKADNEMKQNESVWTNKKCLHVFNYTLSHSNAMWTSERAMHKNVKQWHTVDLLVFAFTRLVCACVSYTEWTTEKLKCK